MDLPTDLQCIAPQIALSRPRSTLVLPAVAGGAEANGIAELLLALSHTAIVKRQLLACLAGRGKQELGGSGLLPQPRQNRQEPVSASDARLA